MSVMTTGQGIAASLIAHGVEASDVDVQPWGSFVTFADSDGNTWTLQQLPAWSQQGQP